MPLPSFTITGTLFDLLGNVAAGEIVGNGLGGATPATVTFASNVPQGYFVTFGGVAYRVDEVTATVNSDGTITRNGDPVQLLANDAGLSIEGLQWQCHVNGMHRFWFNAPVDGGTVNLGTVAPVPGIGVGGVAFSAGELITLLADSGSPVRVALDALYGPGAVDEYHPYANLAAFPATGVTDRLYLAMDTGKLYRWTGSAYLQIADKAAVGLGNVDNTSDVNKPVSTAQAAADALKLSISAVVDNADGTISVGSVKGQGLLPLAAAVVTANTAPAIGKTTYYNASGGALNIPLLALSTLTVGEKFAVRRDPADKSNNAITFTCAGSDAFYSSGSTSFTLPISGEQRAYEVVSPAGTKYYAPSGPINPVAGNDARYANINIPARNRVAITNNCYAMSPTVVTPNTVTAGTFRFLHTVGVSAVDVQLVFGNFYLPTAVPRADTDPTTSITFKASVEDTAGNIFPVTFNGSLTCTLAGGGIIACDPVPIALNAGDVLAVRVYLSSGTFYCNRWSLGSPFAWGDGFTAGSDLTGKGSAAPANAFALGFGPMAILGAPTSVASVPKALLAQGDSILAGLTGSAATSDGYWPAHPEWSRGGYIMQIMSGQGGVVMIAEASDRLYHYLSNVNSFRRNSFARYGKFALIEYGINDLADARTAAQLQADILTLASRNLARGIVKNIIQTICPQTTSTDNWATTANQTPTTLNSTRIAHNTWVRDGGPIDSSTLVAVAAGTTGSNIVRFGVSPHPIGGYIEVADQVESARNSGLWKVPNRVVNDAAISAGNSVVNSVAAAFTSADVGHAVTINGAGTAGAVFNSRIHLVPSYASLTSAAATTVSGATMLIGPSTFDGVHPSDDGHNFIATGVGASLLAQLT